MKLHRYYRGKNVLTFKFDSYPDQSNDLLRWIRLLPIIND